LAGFSNPEAVQDLREFDCGDYEGLTAAEVRANRPGWDFWRDGYAGGETQEGAAVRVDRVLTRLNEAAGATLVFSHASTIRTLVARYLGLEGRVGSAFGFDPAHIGIVAVRRGYHAIIFWNYGEHLPEELKEPKAASALPH
jgi:probable phosphoglycerate mutase